eukprot:CAMPEP_0196593958 /NCGR_PEP_ID=MMETSP1081-20130531/77007_1 /TAXON_ID=36882 /ORGANISM="Pyramimonas amylifera, Strain CCMP720" /LENGTH=209 /DNA_ID=CAMNT_0041918085 /DNA_START=975 /DNA_END=1604 /DNA_ORIENTATION=-
MIALGFMERYFLSPLHQIAFVLSMTAFGITLRHFRTLFELSAVELMHQQDRLNLRRVHNFTVCVWTLFPVLRLCKLAGILSIETEEIGNTMLDLAAKLVFTVCLKFVNFVVIDQVTVDRLNLARQYFENLTNKKDDGEEHMYFGDQSEGKKLAYKDAEVWRNRRLEAMQNDGFPSQKASQLLEMTLGEYVALSKGNISSYLRNRNSRSD